MLSVKQGSIKYHFLNLWYDSIEPRSPGPLVYTLTIIPKSGEQNLALNNTQGLIYLKTYPNQSEKSEFISDIL